MKRKVAEGLVQALLYRRVSGAEHQKEGLSLLAQEAALRRYVVARDGWVIAQEYEDILSGKRADRPAYQAMLDELRRLSRAGKRVAVVVVRLDRLGRNKAEYFRAAEEISRLGVEVHSVKDGGVLDETHASILAVFAAKEAKDIGGRVADTRAQLVNDGYHYGRTPFGYRKRKATPEEIASGVARRMASGGLPHVFEPDPVTRGVATEVFTRVAGGQSISKTSDWLAALPEQLRGGRNWPAQTVTGMLQSPTYVARPAEGDDDVLSRPKARWEPLVTDEVYAAVQAQIAGHVRRPHQASGRFLLTSFIRCPVCGERLVGASKSRKEREGGRRFEYRCSGWTRGANAPVPGCRWALPMQRADMAVLDQVVELVDVLVTPERLPELQHAWDAQMRPSEDITPRLSQLEREIAAAQKRLASAAGLLADGTLDALGYGLLRDSETDKITAAEAERQSLSGAQRVRRPRLPSLSALLDQAGAWGRILREVDVAHQRALLDELIDQVVIRRVGYRAYAATITWTHLGNVLRSVVSEQAASGDRAAAPSAA